MVNMFLIRIKRYFEGIFWIRMRAGGHERKQKFSFLSATLTTRRQKNICCCWRSKNKPEKPSGGRLPQRGERYFLEAIKQFVQDKYLWQKKTIVSSIKRRWKTIISDWASYLIASSAIITKLSKIFHLIWSIQILPIGSLEMPRKWEKINQTYYESFFGWK